MNTPAKARVAVLICALFIVWPAVHRVVVAIYATNAWQLGGFAMYATPPARTAISIVEKHGNRQTIWLEGAQPAALVEQRRRYLTRRAVLGRLLPPDALAEAYFQARPQVDHIDVVIKREMLRASTARIERREDTYVYDRPLRSDVSSSDDPAVETKRDPKRDLKGDQDG